MIFEIIHFLMKIHALQFPLIKSYFRYSLSFIQSPCFRSFIRERFNISIAISMKVNSFFFEAFIFYPEYTHSFHFFKKTFLLWKNICSVSFKKAHLLLTRHTNAYHSYQDPISLTQAADNWFEG